MFRRYIEAKERAFHGRDRNRRSLPFDWGLDHLGMDPHTTRAPEQALRDYSTQALAASDRFFACEPSGEYAFDGHILKFPSFMQTPYPENNTVWGRFFDGGRELAALILPQWNCPWDGQTGLCRMLQRFGISALRLSMPYHHGRKPAEIERSEYLVSPNVGRTLAAARQSVVDARRAADWLYGMGHRRVAIVGTSIGSCIAFLTFAHDERFSSGVFIHVSSYFADVVWSGLSTSHVRHSLEGAVGLPLLRSLWEPISPFPYIPRLQGTRRSMLMLAGRYDLTFRPELTAHTQAELERCGIAAEILWLPCGHYTMGTFPMNAAAGCRILTFLLEERGGRA